MFVASFPFETEVIKLGMHPPDMLWWNPHKRAYPLKCVLRSPTSEQLLKWIPLSIGLLSHNLLPQKWLHDFEGHPLAWRVEGNVNILHAVSCLDMNQGDPWTPVKEPWTPVKDPGPQDTSQNSASSVC